MADVQTVKVFLDIGAHLGETLRIVQDPKWEFDRIVCFEPAPDCWPTLDGLADERTEICRFGLWRQDATMVLNNPGSIGASVFTDKDAVEKSMTCDFRDVASWFGENVRDDDTVFVKVNIEGAEADLFERLDGAGLLGRVDHLLVHFDVRKVPSQRSREAGTRALLTRAGIEFQAAEDIQFGIVPRGTVNWLAWCHGTPGWRWVRRKVLARAEFAARRMLYPFKVRFGHVA